MSGFVDFKAVKAAVSMQAVLDRYNINWLRKSKDELRGRCPIHKGEGSETFHVSLTKNAFHCFSCKKRGNVLDFCAAMENCTVRDAAAKLAEWFSVPTTDSTGNGQGRGESPTKSESPATAESEKEETVNKPLTFQLRGVDSAHSYLASRGVSPEFAAKFGVGFFPGKGSMSGRVVIPIHNTKGELVAYAGRAIDGTEPKYKLPAGFHKSVELFNLHRAAGEENKRRLVVVVEGFFDCIKVTAAGFPCVALMGCSMSERQQELLGAHFKAAWLMLDGDEAGRTAAAEIGGRLMRSMWVRQAVVPEGKQPDSMGEDEVRQALK